MNKLAQKSGYSQRSRKIQAYDLIESVLFSSFETDKLSLNDHCAYLLVHKGIIVSKQSVDGRFNEKSVLFMKQLLEDTLKEEMAKVDGYPLIDCFTKVRIKDSVSFQLPGHLSPYYRGSGGSGSKAMVKIQFEFDLISKQILELSITPFTENDLSNAMETVDCISPGDLVIRDLGYVNLKVLDIIAGKRHAYYLNRFKPPTSAYQEDNDSLKKIDFVAMESKMRKDAIGSIEFKAYIGEDDRLPVRMIVQLVPEQIKAKRIRERKAYAKKKKRQVDKETLSRCGVNIFITNACEDLLPISSIAPIYGIRWQVENIFKAWKSIGGIHKIKKISKSRFEFYLYAKLIFLVKIWQIMRFVELSIKECCSFYKFMKIAFVAGNDHLDKLIDKMEQAKGIERYFIKDIRNGRINEVSIKSMLYDCISDL